MSLSMDFLFQAMTRQFHTQPSDDRFQKDFVVACNAALDQMSFHAELATPIGHISKTSDSVEELDPKHSFILLAGLASLLADTGYEHSEGAMASDRLLGRWIARLGDYRVMKSREDQATQDDEGVPTSDIAGLGYLGDDD